LKGPESMNTPIITLPGLTIDISALRSIYSANGYPQWQGKVVLTLIDGIDRTSTVVTANWSGKEESSEGTLVDFEGESEDPTIYDECEMSAAQWSIWIAKNLGYPSAFDAHANDLADPTFAARHEPKAA
jgi:hypothetical protein